MQLTQYLAALPAALHGMLKVAADRLGISELAKLLTPSGNIVEHLTPWDFGLRAQEEQHRLDFVSSRAQMMVAWASGQLLLDMFEPATFDTFLYQAPMPSVGECGYPQLFTHMAHPAQRHPLGSPAVVQDLDTFKTSFNMITGGLFENVDWSNMIVAGGAVLACLMRPPDAVAAADPSTPAGGALWQRWLGPNEVMSLATSGFGDSDIDIFFYGLDRQQATLKLRTLLEQLHYSRRQDSCSLAVRSEHAVTLVVEASHAPPARTGSSTTSPHRPPVNTIQHVQVVLRLYSCPAEVLMGFDIDSCCVAFDGERLSPSYETRLAKYSRRGFRVAVPGFPGRRGIDSSIYLLPYMECKGLAKLLRLEQKSLSSGYQVGVQAKEYEEGMAWKGYIDDLPVRETLVNSIAALGPVPVRAIQVLAKSLYDREIMAGVAALLTAWGPLMRAMQL
eukprot:gene8499-8681_t